MNIELRAWVKLEDWTSTMLYNEHLSNWKLEELQSNNENVKVMKSIGYRDSNGDMIFESDIVSNEAWFFGEVYFDEKELQWKMKAENGSTQAFSWYIDNDYHKLTVTGNKYLNA